jgi:hypothetical protein
MNKFFLSLGIGFVVLLAARAAVAEEIFTGDKRLACEALLCLSSGVRPGECNPALSRYFSITHKKPGKETNMRKSFLELCPAASENAEMRNLTDAIANGAGRCDANYLNRTHRQSVQVYACTPQTTTRQGRSSGTTRTPATPVSNQAAGRYTSDQPGMNCTPNTIRVINNRLPAYCVAYSGHEYTYQIGVTYVGDRLHGGHWVQGQF